MITAKYISKIIVSIALVFGLSSGSVVSADPAGPKEELSLEFKPAAEAEASDTKAAVETVTQSAPAKETVGPVQTTPNKEIARQESDIREPGLASKASGKKSWFDILKGMMGKPVKMKSKKVKAVKPVEAKPAAAPPALPARRAGGLLAAPAKAKPAAVKKAPAVKTFLARKPAQKKEIISSPVSIGQTVDFSDTVGGVANRWFGLETGAENMGARRTAGMQVLPGRKADDLFTLHDCIDIAVKNNVPLQIAEKSVKLARMRVLEARRNMLPTVTVAFEPYTGKVNARNYIGRKQYIEGKQPIFHGGELYFTLKQAEANLEITRNEGNKIKNELMLQVKKAYYTLAKAGNNLKMQAELSGEVGRIFQMVNDQYDANVASKLELLNVSSQESQIKYQLASAEGDVSIAELILKQAMNVDPEIRVDIMPKLDFNKIKVRYEDALTAALSNRPEMRINLLMLDYYAYGKRIAESKNMPKVDLMGNWGLAKEEYMPIDNAWGNTGFNNQIGADQRLEQQWYAGVKTSLPLWGSTAEYSWTREQWTPVISAYQGTEATTNSFKFKVFDNLAAYSEKQLSEIDSDRARQEFNKMKQDITLEVKEQCFSYQKALIQLDTALNKVKYQESDFEFVKMKRSLDEAADSNVIESMIKLSQERFGYVQALADCHTVVASINKAIGIEDYYSDE